jgi:dTDP-4-dehydrorhamnose reductase
MKLLVTGASGFLGARLCQALASMWQITGTFLTRPERVPPGIPAQVLDVRDAAAVAALFAQVRPDAVVHTAAMASLAACAERPDEADACNRDGTRHIARSAKHVPMVYLSTDLVFDGGRGWYPEEEIPRPSCLYGRSKRAGEEAAQDENPDVCILRLALTYGFSANARRCFMETMLASLRQGEQVRLFADEYRTPLFVDDLCRTVGLVLAAGRKGVCHATGLRRLSRYELGLAAARAFGLPAELIVPVSQSTVDPTRPRDCSLLASTRLTALGCAHRDPAEALAHMAATRLRRA